MPGRSTPPADAKIVWVSIDPVQSRFKTMEFRADLWIPATAANVIRAVYEAATGMLDKSDMSRIEERRKRLETRKEEIEAKIQAEAAEAVKKSTSSGCLVAYELGKVLEPDAILLNDGLSNSRFVENYARRTLPGSVFKSGSSAGGWGVGAAFGAKMAAPKQDVVLASGDGFFEFGTPSAAPCGRRRITRRRSCRWCSSTGATAPIPMACANPIRTGIRQVSNAWVGLSIRHRISRAWPNRPEALESLSNPPRKLDRHSSAGWTRLVREFLRLWRFACPAWPDSPQGMSYKTLAVDKKTVNAMIRCPEIIG